MTKQIAIADMTYDHLNTLRHTMGNKYSFNTVIVNLIRMAITGNDDTEFYRKMQWHAIQSTLKRMAEQGWVKTYTIQYAHVLRLLFTGDFKCASDYILEQLPDSWNPPPPKSS